MNDQPTPPAGLPDTDAHHLDRRRWIQQAATLAGAAAAAAAPVAATSAAVTQTSGASGTRVTTPAAGVVDTTSGKVRGFTRNGVHIFRGIPYGETTEGAGRFLPPQKPKPWTGVRSSTSWGPVCPAGPRAGWRNDEEQFLYQWDDGFAGEDMLRVNVWTPAVNDGQRRPVLVWIHGGGFVSGSSQELRPYDGENLARRHNAVLVSMNHRLNVFGFLDLSQIGGDRYASSANAGMLDLVLALEWVRDNIADFGGDPGSVTIFGQSGGARKVSTLLAMPVARGLFHKAAVLSGSHLRQILPEVSDRLANAVLQELAIGRGDVGRLHQVPTADLLRAGIEAQRKAAAAAPAGSPAPNWGPVVDGRVLPQHAFDPAAPAISAAVPMLIGNTFCEFGGGVNNPAAHELTIAGLRERLQPTVGARADEVIAAYQKVFPAAQPFEIWGVVVGTRSYRAAAITQAELKAAQNAAPAYMYWFGWKTPVLDGRPLAYHCQDLAFWFDNIDLAAQATGGTDDARDLATKMSRALVAFARTGDPNHGGLPRWAPFTASGRATMIFENERAVVRNDPDREARRLI
jgi:para-nitrobenzyl esterase